VSSKTLYIFFDGLFQVAVPMYLHDDENVDRINMVRIY
jgi:hypothetical protein